MRFGAVRGAAKVLVVESGSRRVVDAAIPRLRQVFGAEARLELVTCYAGVPGVWNPEEGVRRTQDYPSTGERARLIRELRASGVTVVAMVCSGEKIMTRWKWWLAWKLPAKVLIVNENADFFWLDAAHTGVLRRFLVARMGVGGEGAGQAAGRLAAFPLVLIYLLLYAAAAHGRRALRNAIAPRTAAKP